MFLVWWGFFIRTYQLICSKKQSELLLAPFVLEKLFGISLPLGKHLKKKNINLIDAIENADNVRHIIENIRKNAVSEFKTEWNALNIEISLLRRKKSLLMYNKILLKIN